ncbi:Gldg family protein [Pseudobacter ginsenosidimutans]|uniref:ABC-2 type transport system permease protein n=1 Tax=Pseudobacter ginsenosidimutans TaxID=661488 RepID=A0A4Q7N0Q9_9BACT|nr:Gldg family protein [Pseudobacter ginsenosidimutans]RZS74179.1 ABC-2 type transport system permease protein [Pseudobacter ginsenosidimutans]
MRIIAKIARAELRSLFYSPIAWVVGIAFFLLTGLRFVIMMYMYSIWQEGMQEVSSTWDGWGHSLTNMMFDGLYETVTNYLYLFIPLLTMGVINKEFNAGTIKLLYSSPVKPRDIVFGKYLGLMGFICILFLLLILLMSAGAFSIGNMDFHVLPGALLGYFLLAATYVSIGLFISSLTNYQIVAGVFTFVVFFLLQIMGTVWQQYDLVRDLTWFLSINGRVRSLASGLITSRDLIYFLVIIAMFIGFSLIRLRSFHEMVGWRTNLSRYLSIIAVSLLIGYFSSRPGYILYADVSRNEQNTIMPVTQDVVAELGNDTLKVTLYTNLFDPAMHHGLPQARNKYIWDFWEKYIRFHPNIQLNYVYYYDLMDRDTAAFHARYPNKSIHEIAEENATASRLSVDRFKMPQEIRKIIDLSEEEKILVMQLAYKGKKAWLRVFPSRPEPWPLEMHVSAAIRRLTGTSMPEMLFTTGHFERSPFKAGEKEFRISTTYKAGEESLINEGIDTDTIDLAQQDIPDSTAVLVIADPKSAYTETEKEKILSWIAKGGNTIFYGEPGKQQMLNPILQTIGVKLENGTIVKPTKDEMPHIFEPVITSPGNRMADEPFLFRYRNDKRMTLRHKFAGSTAVTVQEKDGFKAEPVFMQYGDDSTWIENGVLVVDSAAPVYAPAEGDLRMTQYATAVKLSRKVNNKEQRIVVTGDADFMSDFRGKGGPFANAAYSWLVYNEFPKYTNRPLPIDTKFLIGEDTGRILYIVYLIVLPVVFIIMGIIILVRRNRK